jgi:hypothetical protein
MYLMSVSHTIPIKIKTEHFHKAIEKATPFKKTFIVKIPLIKDRNVDLTISNIETVFNNPSKKYKNGYVNIRGKIYANIDGSIVKGDFDLDSAIKYKKITKSFHLDQIIYNSITLSEFSLNEKDKKIQEASKAFLDFSKGVKNKLSNYFKQKTLGNKKELVHNKINYIDKIKKDIIIKLKSFTSKKLSEIKLYKINNEKINKKINNLPDKNYKIFLSKLAINNYDISIGDLFKGDMEIKKEYTTIRLNTGNLVSNVYRNTFITLSWLFALIFISTIFTLLKRK